MTSPSPSLTVVCFAVPDEARHFRKLLETNARPGIEVLITGMGQTQAERALRDRLARGKPALVITAGFAGGLRQRLKPGQVLYEHAPPALAQRLEAAGARRGTFFCAEKVAVTAREKTELGLATGCDAVEMESGSLRAVCQQAGVPCATVRVILDLVDEDLPLDFNRLMDDQGRVRPLQVAAAIALNPGKVPRLCQLGTQTRTCARVLGETLLALTA